MGLIAQVLGIIFGNNRNVLVETAQVFRENAEAGAARQANRQAEALTQFAAEFATPRNSLFDRVMDAVNRLPRPALALGTLGLFIAAMYDPIWFATRMQGIALVPEPLWWLLGVIVSFYFGARHQQKSQAFQHAIAGTLAQVPQVRQNIARLQDLRSDSPAAAQTGPDAQLAQQVIAPDSNPALEAWRNAKPRQSR